MNGLSKILVPVEFSPRCRGAVQYAEALACHFHSEILLLHCVVPPVAWFGAIDSVPYYTTGEVLQDLEQARTNELEAFPCEAGKDVPVRRIVASGDPAQVIVDTAAAERCGLIVMPTHGYGPFRKFLLGSVTAKVLHDAACPVWTGPHMENASDPAALRFRRVLCAVDLGVHSRDVMCWAAQFAAGFAADLMFVHAIPYSTIRLGSFYFDPEWRLMMMQRAWERIAFLKQELGTTGDTLVEAGEPGSVVHDVAADRCADVVVIGRGTGPQGHRRLPSNAYAIVRDAPCPVVSI